MVVVAGYGPRSPFFIPNATRVVLAPSPFRTIQDAAKRSSQKEQQLREKALERRKQRGQERTDLSSAAEEIRGVLPGVDPSAIVAALASSPKSVFELTMPVSDAQVQRNKLLRDFGTALTAPGVPEAIARLA